MKRLALIIGCLLISGSAMAQTGTPKPKASLQSEINSQIPDNLTGAILPQVMRNVTSDMLASWQQYPNVNAQVGTTYAFVAADYGTLITFTNTNPVAVSLPQAIGSFTTGWNVWVANKSTGVVTITPAGSLINGAATFALNPSASVWIISDGTNYQVWNNSSGTVTSIGLSMPGSVFHVQNTPITSSGTLSVTISGTSGGIPYFDTSSDLTSTAAGAANAVFIGGSPPSFSGLTISPTSSAQLAIAPSKSLTATNSLTLSGTDNKTLTVSNSLTLSGTDGKALGLYNSVNLSGTDGKIYGLPTSNANVAALDVPSQLVTGGAITSTLVQSAGSFQINCGSRPVQAITNTGAFAITAPVSDSFCLLFIQNAGNAGAVSFSGFTVGSNTGDAITITSGNKYTLFIWHAGGTISPTSGYSVFAHQ